MAETYSLDEVRKMAGGKSLSLDEVKAMSSDTANERLPFRPLGIDTGLTMPVPLSNFLAGTGKGMVDVARGLGQLVGAVDREDVKESRRLDAPLMRTDAGQLGNFTGAVAATLPTVLIPGANTIKGATAIGALTGLAAPSESTRETLTNTAMGGAAAPLVMAGMRGAQAVYQGAKGLAEPFTRSGQERLAAEVLQRSATNPRAAAAAARSAEQLVPGSIPTLAQSARDDGLAQLERTMLNNPEFAGPLNMRIADQRMARQNVLRDMAGRGDHYDDIVKGREIFAREDYARAMSDGIDKDMAKALKPQIDNLMQRPSVKQAIGVAKELAAENGQKLSNFGSIEGLDWLKKALDNQISAATKPGSSIGDAKLRALVQTKNDLMSVLEQVSPAYKTANDNFAAMSSQVNSMDVAKSLRDKLNRPGSQYLSAGTAREQGEAYRQALEQAFDSVKKATGQNKSITQVMSPEDVKMLENIARDQGRVQFAQNAGRAVGSPTAQNIASQNLLRRILGPTGLPESWAESTVLQGLLSPVQGAARISGADRRVMERIVDGLVDRDLGVQMLTRQAMVPSVSLLGAPPTQRFIAPVVGGLLAN